MILTLSSLVGADVIITFSSGNGFHDSKVHGANMGPTWGRQDPGGSHVYPMKIAIWLGAIRHNVDFDKIWNWQRQSWHQENFYIPWWHHLMGTFSTILTLCEENLLVTGGFPSERPVTQSFDVFFDLRLNNRLSKQSGCQWFEMPSCSLWHHCDGDWWIPFTQSPVDSPHKGQWCGALIFSLMHAWTNRWVNVHDAGDMRCHDFHCDVTLTLNTGRRMGA